MLDFCQEQELFELCERVYRPAKLPLPPALSVCITNIEVRDTLPPRVHYSRRRMMGKSFLGLISEVKPVWVSTTLLLYGVDERGASALVVVSGFKPKARFMLLDGSHPSRLLSVLLDSEETPPEYRIGVTKEDVEVKELRMEKAWGFDPHGAYPVVELAFSSLKKLAAVRRKFESENPGWVEMEKRVDPVTHALAELKLRPCSWVRIEGYRQNPMRLSHCAIEVEAEMRNLSPETGPDGESRSDIPDLLELSYDGEMFSETRGFPDASLPNDCVYVISIDATWFRSRASHTIVLCKGLCEPVEGVTVLCFPTERDLLNAFRDIVALCAPQFLVGFNQFQFDDRYFHARSQKTCALAFPFCGKLVLSGAKVLDKNLDSAAKGDNDLYVLQHGGVTPLDVMKDIQNNHAMEQYSLNACCEKFLPDGDAKVDLPYDVMFELIAKGEMREVVEYAAKDAMLPSKLVLTLHMIPCLFELARVSGAQMEWLVLRGQQIKVFTQLYNYCSQNMVMLNPPMEDADETGYEGATVLEPEKGFFLDPTATLDFASLYPSIMMAHNLCFSTIIIPRLGTGGHEVASHQLSGRTVEFVDSSVKKGILPRMLKEILTARKTAKAAKKQAKTEMEAIVQDSRQLALKVSANSIYGFAAANMYPCKSIAEVVTMLGRSMINETKRIVTETIPDEIKRQAPGFAPRVIYGDTDSVMVLCAGLTVDQCHQWGVHAAKKVTDFFPGEIELEMEEVKCPFNLLRKKGYVYRSWTLKGDSCVPCPKIEYKGIELKRRDNAPIVKKVQRRALDDLFAQHLYEPDASPSWRDLTADGSLRAFMEGAKETTIRTVGSSVAILASNTLPLEDFVISKSLKRAYKNDLQPHLVVRNLKEKRVPGSGDAVGSRVRFFYREMTYDEAQRPASEDKVTLRAEDPDYAEKNGISADLQKYVMNVEKATMHILTTLNDARLPSIFEQARQKVKKDFEAKMLRWSIQNRRSIYAFLEPRGGSSEAPGQGEPKEAGILEFMQTRDDADARGCFAPLPRAAPSKAKKRKSRGLT